MHDYIIVGQGIAGSLLSHFLLKKNKRLAIIDNHHHQASSMVAAGMINPITGRNFVKSWEIDTLIPFAKKTYLELEAQLGISIFDSKNVAMIFGAVKAENDWMVRSSSPDVTKYVTDDFELDFYTNFLAGVQNGVEFQQAGRANLKELVLAYKKVLQDQVNYLEESFDYSELEILENHVNYKGIEAKRIIFAEGFQATENPYFNYLPFAPAKGDILLVKIPNYPAKDKLVKHGVFIIHLHDDVYWVGSTYNRDYKTLEPKPRAKAALTERLQRVLKLPFEVLEHIGAARPTVRDRRPFLGQHPTFSRLYLFNGMGAKGATLTPFFASQLIDYLEDGAELNKEVDISRYYRYFEEESK
jgi:glycine oxidase